MKQEKNFGAKEFDAKVFYIGCHLSASKGFAAMGRDAVAIGANVFQFFTRNPRGGKAKAWAEDDIAELEALAREHQFGPLLAHAPYTMNACGKEERVRQFALEAMADDLARLERLSGCLYNFHPGSHVGQGVEVGIERIAAQLNQVLWPEMKSVVLLEAMAGKGSEIGGTFEELRAIIERVDLSDKVGVCLDTCHLHDAGYDLVGDLDGVLAEFDRVLGLERLRAVHLNDSMNVRGARKDRHARLGEGELGLEAITKIINHPRLRKLPFYLETPNDDLAGYGAEIALLKTLYQED